MGSAIGIEAARPDVGAYEAHICDVHMGARADAGDGWRWYACELCGGGWTMAERDSFPPHPDTACGATCSRAAWTAADCIGCGCQLAEHADGSGRYGAPCAVCVTAATGIHPLDADALARLDFSLCRICGARERRQAVAAQLDCSRCSDALDAVFAALPERDDVQRWNRARGLAARAALSARPMPAPDGQPAPPTAWGALQRAAVDSLRAAADAAVRLERRIEATAGAARASCVVCGALVGLWRRHTSRECPDCAALVDEMMAAREPTARRGPMRRAMAEATDDTPPAAEPTWARAMLRRDAARRWLYGQPTTGTS